MWTYQYTDELYHYGVLGMKWGVRRYQNKDGTLTSAGKKRYDRDIKDNNSKKKENRIVIDGPDARRWAKEDVARTKKVVDSSSDAVKQTKNLMAAGSKKRKLDLSKMTDQQLRDRINRANLERQYNDLFGEESATVSRGREYANKILDGAGTILTVGSSVLGIALAIKELRG